MLNIGHRGAMGHEPENTLLSIQKAIELGADYVEIDVHFVDGQLVVIHDDTLDRTTNYKGLLANYTFEELRKADAGKGQRIPILKEVVDLTKNMVGLNIELKGKGAAKPVHYLLSELTNQHRDNILVSSFHVSELVALRKLDNKLRIGVLSNKRIEHVLDAGLALNAFSIHVNNKVVTKLFIDRVHQAGFKVYAYTVNTIEELLQMISCGVDGVFSNYPDRVLSMEA
jgi:glycerophosphoryl diester phosphodiesterase